MGRTIKCIEDENGCWNVKSSKNRAHKRVNGKYMYISHMMMIDKEGSIPNGMVVCHSCDNPRCINPEHLFLGTQIDNMQDMVNKGRQNNKAKGRARELNARAKFTEEQIQAIRNDTRPQTVIAKEYGTSQGYISNIVRGRSWKEGG